MKASRLVISLGFMIAAAVGSAEAQKSGPPAPASGTNTNPVPAPVRTVNLGNLANPDAIRREVEQAQKDAIIERQKRIQKDTLKLLKLTAEFKADVDGLATGQFTADTFRKLEQIEKLAHEVRERTRKK